ncbi:uncharacterized protein LOC121296381 isoform X2 [Polyodon spathula]|uniref:uncharacterized protein LOC121296381 isoform X2 n=1 Tax=Polyodon spathula TaxID=7913 RepID=UPI001B7DEC48|nr:uncharacterized protein LOC121296381 isoform X2 [Polyodon spathula]
MYNQPCRKLTGLVGVSILQSLENAAQARLVSCNLVQQCRSSRSKWITFQHCNFLKRQYVTKTTRACQRAKPKQEALTAPLVERHQHLQDETVIRQVQQISEIDQHPSSVQSAKETPTQHTEGASSDEDPSTAQESQETRQWKEIKVVLGDLPGIYARLSKIRLTALVVMTASAGYAMAPVTFDPSCFLLASLGTGLASCAANSINQPSPRSELCCSLCSSWHHPAHPDSEPPNGSPGCPKPLPVHLLLHPPEEADHHQHLGGGRRWGDPPCYGLDSCHRQPGRGCPAPGRDPVLLAVPSFQRSQLEPAGGLLQGRLPHDVRHPPGTLPESGTAAQPGPHRTVCPGAGPGRHQLDLPTHLPPHQPVHQLPRVQLLQRRGPQQRPQTLLLQPLAPAHAAAPHAHL